MKKSLIKKLVMLLCIISMLSTLCACGSDDKSSKDSKKTSKKAEKVEEDEEEYEDEEDYEVEEEYEDEDVDYEEEVEEDYESDDEDVESAIEMVTGVTSGNTYENYYFGIGVSLDSDWTFDSQDEIEARRQQTIAQAGGTDNVKEAFDVTITDMIAIYKNGTDTMNIGIEKPNATGEFTEDDYINAAIDPTCSMLGQMGMEDIEYDTGTYDIQGQKHGAMKIHGTYQGSDVYEMLVVIKEGDYIAVITTCTWQSDSTEDIARLVYLL